MAKIRLDPRMTRFLVDLAIDDPTRERFSANKDEVLAELQDEGMSETAANLIREHNDTIKFMVVNNQSNVGGLVGDLLARREAGTAVKVLRASITASGGVPLALGGGAASKGPTKAAKKKAIKKKAGKKKAAKKPGK